jgi:CRISPR/Cas system-associated exonuclease Cas4 (RecB family)
MDKFQLVYGILQMRFRNNKTGYRNAKGAQAMGKYIKMSEVELHEEYKKYKEKVDKEARNVTLS